MPLLERAWGNEAGLLTLLVLCAAMVCQRAWAVEQRQGVPFVRSRWAQVCMVTLACGSVALGVQLFGSGQAASLPEGRPEVRAETPASALTASSEIRAAAVPAESLGQLVPASN